MPKIKKFNIKLSIYRIQQNLRRAKFPFTEETIHELSALCDELKAKISSAVYFQTFRDVSKLGLPFSLPEGAVGVSIAVSTLGAGADDFAAEHIKKTSMSLAEESKEGDNNETPKNILVSAVISEGAEEVKKFPWKIISEEAAEEKCVLSERKSITDIRSLEHIKEILSKIEVFPTENGLRPIYSFVEYAFWLPLAKKKFSPLSR